MYLFEVKASLLTSSLSAASQLREIQPGQSRSVGFVKNDEEDLVSYAESEVSSHPYLTFRIQERKYSRSAIKAEAERRAKLPEYSRWTCPNTGVVNLRGLREEILQEILNSAVPSVKDIKVYFLTKDSETSVMAVETSSAMDLDSILESLPTFAEDLEWAPSADKVEAGLLVRYHDGGELKLSGSWSVSGTDGERLSGKNADIIEATQCFAVESVNSLGFDTDFGEIVVNNKGRVKVESLEAIYEAVNILKELSK